MRCIVIGAGLLGLTTAWFLRRSGAEVVVVERGAGPALETSFANGGMLHASQASPWNEPGVVWQALRTLGHEDAALLIRLRAVPRMLGWMTRFFVNSSPRRYAANLARNARLAQYSLRVLDEHFSELGADFERADRGTLKIYRDRSDFEVAARVAEQCRDFDIPFRALDAAATVALEPALQSIESMLVGGIHFPSDVSGDAHLFCRALAAAAREAGVTFEYETQAERLVALGGRITGVDTNVGFQRADKVVVAAGSHSTGLMRTAGVPLAVQPVKGYSITIAMNDWERKPSVPVIDEHFHAAVCPLGERLRVAGTAEITGFDDRLTPARIDNLFKLVEQVYPQGAAQIDRKATTQWCGFRPMSPDGVGLMGETRIDGLFVNTGHGHLGWTMAPAAGKLLADRMTGTPTAIPIEDYLPGRFA